MNNLINNAQTLKIFVGEDLRSGNDFVHEKIIYSARVWGLSGATITKSTAGFGEAEIRPEQSGHKLRISNDKPVIIEIVDTEENIMGFIPQLHEMLGDHGLITLTSTKVLHYGKLRAEPEAK